MSSINAGKQQVSFDWYKGNSATVKDVLLTPATDDTITSIPVTLLSSTSYNIKATDLLPSNYDHSRSLSPSESIIISMPVSPREPLPQLPSVSESLLSVHTQQFYPVEDQVVLSRSPVEPSRIRRPISSFQTSAPHLAAKHPHPVEDENVPHTGELPLKRVRVDGEIWDFNTIAGSDRINFEFTRQAPADIISLEEAERSDRMKRRANPVLVGRFFNIQKEFMRKVNKPISMPILMPIAPLARGLSDSIADLKETIIEKGMDLIDSSKNAINNINSHPLKSTLNTIAIEADQSVAFRPLSLEGEKIDFVWPRIPAEIKAAEELARSERTSQGVSPVLFGKWKALNTELRNKWATTGISLAKVAPKTSIRDSAGALVGKAAHVLDEAVHYTTGMMENLGLKSAEPAHDLAWINLQQEKERARRINESLLSPSIDVRKSKLENQLLRTIALKSKSEL